MSRLPFIIAPIALLMFCSRPQETSSTSTTSTTSTSSQVAVTTPAPVANATVATQSSTSTMTTPAPASGGPSLASQETNWAGVTAEVTEFRRKGNTVTAKVRLTNKGSSGSDVDILFKEVALIDATNGKKYEVLKDEKDTYIGSLRPGWHDRWSKNIDPGSSQLIWMKFPAPPPEVKTITLQLPQMPPFDDLTIQD